MGRVLRFVGSAFEAVEMTWRCAQSRFLLRPGAEANRRVVGVIGQAMRLYGRDVQLYFAGGTCNHLHVVAAFRSAEAKAAWTCHVRANLSKELGALFGWPGCHWERRSSDIPIVDEGALYQRLVYLAGQATRAGLVRRAAERPCCGEPATVRRVRGWRRISAQAATTQCAAWAESLPAS